jgi:hypothetical protein
MAGILGLQRQGEASDRQQPVAALAWRRRLNRPREHALAADLFILVRLGEGDEAPEQRLLDAEPEAQGAVELDVPGQVLAQHGTPPGQGCTTCCSMATSTLA